MNHVIVRQSLPARDANGRWVKNQKSWHIKRDALQSLMQAIETASAAHEERIALRHMGYGFILGILATFWVLAEIGGRQ